MTAFELMHGEQTESEGAKRREEIPADTNVRPEFHDIHPTVLRKALGVLVKRGMAQTMGTEDEMGVKFF